MKRFFISFVFLINIAGVFANTPAFIDSLKIEIDNPNISVDKKIQTLLSLSYHSISEPEQAIFYGQQALDLAEKHGTKSQCAFAYGYIGRAKSNLGNYLEGIESFTMSANLFRESEMHHEEGYALSAIATIFSRNNDYVNAINYNMMALGIFENHHDSISVSTILLNLGESYRGVQAFDSAEHYLNKSLSVLNRIRHLKDSRIDDNIWLVSGNLGMIYSEKKEIDKAQDRLVGAYEYFYSKGDVYRASIYRAELGKLEILKGNYTEGRNLIYESYRIADSLSFRKQLRDFSFNLFQFYEQQQIADEALFYHKKYKAFDDSIKNVEQVRQMEQMQSRLQVTRKEEQIEALNRINQLQRVIAVVLSLSVVILLVLFFMIVVSNQKVKNAYRVIAHQKELVDQKEKDKALLLKELNHRVKNNLQMVASLLNLHARQLKGHPAADALIEGRYRVEALTLIHQKLYRDDVDTLIDVKSYIKELAENLVMNFGSHFQLNLDLENFQMKIDKAIPLGLIINELLTNSLKYGGDKSGLPLLSVTLKIIDDKLQLHIEDNGAGLPEGFELSKSNSFGLKLVNSLSKQLGGNIEILKNDGVHWLLTLNKEQLT